MPDLDILDDNGKPLYHHEATPERPYGECTCEFRDANKSPLHQDGCPLQGPESVLTRK